jgi:hypothetical protein
LRTDCIVAADLVGPDVPGVGATLPANLGRADGVGAGAGLGALQTILRNLEIRMTKITQSFYFANEIQKEFQLTIKTM